MKSPCVKVCTLDPTGKVCTGCKRTSDEIARWTRMSDQERQAVMDRCLASPWGTKCKTCINSRGGSSDPLADVPEAPF